MKKYRFYPLIALFLTIQARAVEIAIVLDDMGNQKRQELAFNLPHQVAFSILPHTHYAQKFAQKAHQQQREVLLHMPMEALSGKALGPGAITANMHAAEVQSTLQRAVNSMPEAIGINNHMGSKLTQLSAPMTVTMSFLRRHNLIFIDSRTTRFSKAARIAEKHGVRHLSRQVFLDHHDTDIKQQFSLLLQIAKKSGKGLAIAHPYPRTLQFLQQQLPTLAAKGVKLVKVSDLLLSPQIKPIPLNTQQHNKKAANQTTLHGE